MTSRANVLASASSLVSRAKSLEDQRKELIEQIEAAKEHIEKQKSKGGRIAALLCRDDLPLLRDTTKRLIDLRTAIEHEQNQQQRFKSRTTQLQSTIESSIVVRQKQSQHDKLSADARSLSMLVDEERQKTATLKFQQSQLSAEFLRAQLTRKRFEQQVSAELDPPVDLTPLQKKKKSLLEQTRLVQAKRLAFEQELADSVDQLERLRIRHEELTKLATESETLDAALLRARILESAAENTALRSYKPLPRDVDQVLEELVSLAETSASLITQTQMMAH
jgi:hypothetical protein